MGDYIMRIDGQTVKAASINGSDIKEIREALTQTVLWRKPAPNYFYIENLSDSANTVTFPKTGSETEWVELEYSLDKTNWANYDLETGVSVPVGGKLYLRGNNNYLTYNATNYHTFVSTGNIGAGGKAISLLSADLSATTVGNRAFQFLFMGNTNLVNTETTLFDGIVTTGTYAFNQVFRDCTNLQNVCAFANVTTATGFSFVQTYYNCTSITNASGFLPNVTSTTGNQVFASTFRGCTSLTTLPSFANVSIGADVSVFNGTFYGCTAVTTPAAMSQNPVNVAGSHKFYQMYYNCTNLQRSPKLTIATATENMLCGIFYNCSNIDYINIEFSAWDGATDFTKNWVVNVHSTGVFCKNATLPVTRGNNYIPNNWSIADLNGKLYAPVIAFVDNNTISITEAEGGASCQIFYTVDGSIPTPENGTLYTQPFTVGSGVTVKAIAHYNGNRADLITDSDVAWAGAIPAPTLISTGYGSGTGTSLCQGYIGQAAHSWKAKLSTPNVDGVTYYINWLNTDNATTFPADPTTSTYDDAESWSIEGDIEEGGCSQGGGVEADSEVFLEKFICDADMVGQYVNIKVIGVRNGYVSNVSSLSMYNPDPIR